MELAELMRNQNFNSSCDSCSPFQKNYFLTKDKREREICFLKCYRILSIMFGKTDSRSQSSSALNQRNDSNISLSARQVMVSKTDLNARNYKRAEVYSPTRGEELGRHG